MVEKWSPKQQYNFHMQYFHLEQPLDEMVLCDREDCEGIADYLGKL